MLEQISSRGPSLHSDELESPPANAGAAVHPTEGQSRPPGRGHSRPPPGSLESPQHRLRRNPQLPHLPPHQRMLGPPSCIRSEAPAAWASGACADLLAVQPSWRPEGLSRPTMTTERSKHSPPPPERPGRGGAPGPFSPHPSPWSCHRAGARGPTPAPSAGARAPAEAAAGRALRAPPPACPLMAVALSQHQEQQACAHTSPNTPRGTRTSSQGSPRRQCPIPTRLSDRFSVHK